MSAVSHVKHSYEATSQDDEEKKQEKRVKRTEQIKNGELKGQFKAKNIFTIPSINQY